jgi:Holliday junction resolvasome RuvABC DNA-binding subunit
MPDKPVPAHAVDALRNERRVVLAFRREQRAFAKQVTEAVTARIADRETFDIMTYELLRHDLDRIMDEWYGMFLNDRRARFHQLIVEQSAESGKVGPRQALAMVRRLAPTSVMRVIEREAA